MGSYTLNKVAESRLFWLGRYIERVYTTIKATGKIYDATVDGEEADYAGYCNKLGIPNVYENTEDFVKKYLGDRNNPCSIISTMTYSLDNAMVERQILGTATLSYVEMALNAVIRATESASPKLELQEALDDIMAFRGSCDEEVDDDICRNTIKTGASMERVDLYLRLRYPKKDQLKELNKLLNRQYKTKLSPDQAALNQLIDDVLTDKGDSDLNYPERIACIERLFGHV